MIGDKVHEDRAAVDVHMQVQLLFEQFHVLGSIHRGVRWNEIQTSSTTTPQIIWLGGCFVMATA